MIRTRKRRDGTTGHMVIYPGIRTMTFDSREDAEFYEADAKRRKRHGAYYQAPPESFGAFLDGYIERRAALKKWRPATKEASRDAAKKLEPLRAVQVPALRVAHIEDLVAQVALAAPRQATRALQLCKSTLRAAEARGQQVDRGIFHIETPSYESREPRFLTPSEFNELSSWMPEYIKRIVPVACLTGLRQGELFDLSDEDVDFEKETIHVKRGKTKAARRRVDLSAEVMRLLREQILARTSMTNLVFPTLSGARWHKSNFINREFHPATLHAGLDGVRFHDMRHTFASLMIAAGVNVKVIAEQMGHSDGGVLVLRRYGHLYEQAGKQAAAKLDALLAVEA